MKIQQATQSYERWLATSMPLIPADLRLKHTLKAMVEATIGDWTQWRKVTRGKRGGKG